MSDPKRFDHLSDGMWQNSAGDYVLYSDYARLKAEVERLKMEESKLLTLCETYEGDLERLRKAGDAMERSLAFTYPDSPKIKDWNAAKEGKPRA